MVIFQFAMLVYQRAMDDMYALKNLQHLRSELRALFFETVNLGNPMGDQVPGSDPMAWYGKASGND